METAGLCLAAAGTIEDDVACNAEWMSEISLPSSDTGVKCLATYADTIEDVSGP
jgi:hypothetical protein